MIKSVVHETPDTQKIFLDLSHIVTAEVFARSLRKREPDTGIKSCRTKLA
jgi:hypothetical protein